MSSPHSSSCAIKKLSILGDMKYDIITMFHVHYYWITQDQRIKVMRKLMNHLNPKHGMLFILILDEG